jgi:hypothetical protein
MFGFWFVDFHFLASSALQELKEKEELLRKNKRLEALIQSVSR